MSMRRSAVATGPMTGAAMRMKRTRRPRSRPMRRAALHRRASLTAALLDLQQPFLHRQTPGVAAETAVGAHRSVARHDQRDRVRAAGAADGTHGGRRADGARDLR